MLITRPYSPRLSWRSPSRISRPMLRLALDIFHFLSDLPKHVRRNVLGDILRVHRQHPNDPVRSSHVIDDAIAAAFTATRRRPPQFPNATGARYYWARFRVAHEHFLQSGVVVIAQVIEDELGKELRIDDKADIATLLKKKNDTHEAAALYTEHYKKRCETANQPDTQHAAANDRVR